MDKLLLSRRLLILMIAALLFFSIILPAAAQESVQTKDIGEADEDELTSQAVQAEEELSYPFTAEAIVLMDAKSGQLLYNKNENKRLYPASITKIMTALLALESGRLEETAVTSELARSVAGNRIYLAEGEETPLIDLIYGLMLNSGNDAAIVIAEHLAGSVEAFADLMNRKAVELGAENTHFVNPHGLHDENHYTTALDMANIARYALQNPLFREIVSTKTMPWFGEEWHSSLINTNRLLWEYEGATGIKTGYTNAAGQTFVASAERDGTELIVVLLKAAARQHLWEEATVLLDYGFQHFETVKVWNKGDYYKHTSMGQELFFEVEEDTYLTLPKGKADRRSWDIRLELAPQLPFLITDSLAGHLVVQIGEKELAKTPVRYLYARTDKSEGQLAAQSKVPVQTQSMEQDEGVSGQLLSQAKGKLVIFFRWLIWPLLIGLLLLVFLRWRRRRRARAHHVKHWPPVS